MGRAGNLTLMPQPSLLFVLRERAGLQPIPTTTSGKIRRSACVEHNRSAQFIRLDA
jgi:hypothetical protein